MVRIIGIEYSTHVVIAYFTHFCSVVSHVIWHVGIAYFAHFSFAYGAHFGIAYKQCSGGGIIELWKSCVNVIFVYATFGKWNVVFGYVIQKTAVNFDNCGER